MKKILTCAALMALTACARVEPVDENALSEVEDLPSAAEIANQVTAANGGTPGLRFAWRADADSGGVVWGPEGQPAGTDPRLAIRCEDEGDQPQLVITHFAQGDRETGVATLRISGNGASASLPMAILEQAGGANHWSADVGSGDLLDSLDDTFGGIGLVNVSLSGAATLQVDAADAVRSEFDRCGANTTSAAATSDEETPPADGEAR